MCIDPITALTIASTAVSAAGSVMQGQQANAAAQAQADAMDQQRKAEQQAAAFEAAQEQRKQSYAQANARAQIGASGVGFQGSPTEVLVANAGQGQLDLEAIRYGSQLRQNTLSTQADLTRMQGKQARTAGFFNAAGSIIGGASKMYENRVRLGTTPFA